MTNSKEVYDVALKLAEIGLRNLQFFIAICTVFGGWIMAGETVESFGSWSKERFVLSAIFTFSTVGLTIGEIEILRRMNAALDLSKDYFGQENSEIRHSALKLFSKASIWRAGTAMGLTLLMINVLIFVR